MVTFLEFPPMVLALCDMDMHQAWRRTQALFAVRLSIREAHEEAKRRDPSALGGSGREDELAGGGEGGTAAGGEEARSGAAPKAPVSPAVRRARSVIIVPRRYLWQR